MFLVLQLAVLSAYLLTTAHAWPGMRAPQPRAAETQERDDPIGPTCTVGAHQWDASAPCPNMPQPPPPPSPAPPSVHRWPASFTVEWKMYFVPDDTDTPPYLPLPRTPYNVTAGRTWYDSTLPNRNMRESYASYCIPVFYAPDTAMGSRNDYSCDFINVGATNTSYVVLHADRPAGAPECCVIGRPFHAPPPDFAYFMPGKWRAQVGETLVDWHAVHDKDAGIFNYGFAAATGEPFAFYMKGVPYLANWMWQPFSGFRQGAPDPAVWDLPAACATATRCPGW